MEIKLPTPRGYSNSFEDFVNDFFSVFDNLGLAATFRRGCGQTAIHSSDSEAERVGGSHADQIELS